MENILKNEKTGLVFSPVFFYANDFYAHVFYIHGLSPHQFTRKHLHEWLMRLRTSS